MYSLWIRNMNIANSEELCIYNDESVMEEYKLVDATLTLEEGSAGSLALKIPRTNIGYGQLAELITQIIVRKNGDVYWIGRLLSFSTDFYGTIDATFEGAYNFLMDTIVTPVYEQTSITGWVTDILTLHNQMVAARGEYFKTIVVGTLDPSLNPASSPDLYGDYETTLDVINNAIEGWKAHPRFDYQEVTFTSNGTEVCKCWCLRLNLYSDYDGSGTLPEIAFGQNLMDYATEGDVSELATCIIPRGAKYSDEDRAIIEEHDAQHPDDRYEPAVPADLDMYRTIYSVTSPKTIYLYAPTAQLNQFGVITKVVDFDDCEDCTELLGLGQKYLQDQKWLKVTISISAVDAKILGYGTEEIKIGRKVHCISPPHNLDFNYPCVGINENLMDVSGTSYTLGVQDESYLTASSRKVDEKLKETVIKAKEREKVLQQNVLTTVYNSPTELFEHIGDSIEAGMETAAELATVYDKEYTMNLLNIFDSELNPNQKGYVHFLREHADYSIDDSKMTLDKLKQRVLKYTPSGSVSAVNNFFNWCKNVINEKYSDYKNYTVIAILGTEDYQTNIAVTANNQGTKNGAIVPYINSSRNNNYSIYNANGYMFRGCLVQTDSSHTGVSYDYSELFAYNSGVNPNMFTYYSYQWPRNCSAWPNKATLDTETNNGYQVYVSKDVYSDSSLNTVYKQQNLFAEAKKTSISFGDLKTRINKYISDSAESNSNTLSEFFAFLKSHMEDERYMVVVLFGPNDYQTSIGLVGWCDGLINGHYVPYLGSPVDTRYTGSTQYFAGEEYTVKYKAYFQSVSPSSYIFNINANDYWSYWFSSNTAACKLATPAFTNSITSPYFPLPNKPTIDSTDYTFFANKNIYTSDLSDVYKTQNLYNQDEPYLNEQDHIYEIVISNTKDYMNSSSNNWCWRWNQYGLYALQGGYSEAVLPDGTYQDANDRVRLALTYDGNIVADRITAGVLNAGVIKAGYLTSWDDSIIDPEHPENTANFVLDISNGIMKAKRGTLIFNGNKPGTTTTARAPQNNFLYLSNEEIGVHAAVGGVSYKSDWMFILGSDFGVDSAGRCYMREGIIGATGGVYDLEAYNQSFVKCVWQTVNGSQSNSRMVYSFDLGSSSSRPLFDQSTLNNPAYKYYYRMARYVNNEFSFLTGIIGPFVFDAGSDPYKVDHQQFNPDITYSGSTTEAETNQPAYYEGEVFPVFYTLNDQATEDYYEEGGHRYVIEGNRNGVEISRDSELRAQYESHSDHRYGTSSSNNGAVHVGTGYLYQGNIGSNASFSLSGINREATLSVPSGNGSSTLTRDDWRFTVGSKFGVTDDGTLYCNGAYLRNMVADARVVATSVDTSSVGGVQLKSSHPTSGDFYSFSLTFDANWLYEGYTAYLDVFLSSASHTDTSGTETPMQPDGNGHISQSNFYSNITFQIIVSAIFVASTSAGGQDIAVERFRGTFTYQKSIETSYTGTGLDVQTFNLGSTQGWTDIPSGATGTHIFHSFSVSVTMENEHTSSSPIWQMAAWSNPLSGSSTSFTGIMNVTNSLSNSSRTCISTGRDVVGGTSYWLGGPQRHWGHAYINNVHTNTSGSGSSKLYKNHIANLADIYDGIFDKLRPVSYYLNEDERHVKHLGFILEEIGEILKEENIDPDIFGAYSPDKEREGGELYYNDFIALNTWQIQKLKKRLDEIEERLYEVDL